MSHKYDHAVDFKCKEKDKAENCSHREMENHL